MKKLVPKYFMLFGICLMGYGLVLCLSENVEVGTFHYETRCICKCKSHMFHQLYAIYLQSPFEKSENCNCVNVVLPKIDLNETHSEMYCRSCDCTFETRSLLSVKICVFVVIFGICVLISYAMALVCLVTVPYTALSSSSSRSNTEHAYQEQQNIVDGYESFGIYNSFEDAEDIQTDSSQSPIIIRRIMHKLTH